MNVPDPLLSKFLHQIISALCPFRSGGEIGDRLLEAAIQRPRLVLAGGEALAQVSRRTRSGEPAAHCADGHTHDEKQNYVERHDPPEK